MRIKLMLCLFLASGGATAADCDLTLEQVLDRSVEARGGHEALDRFPRHEARLPVDPRDIR